MTLVFEKLFSYGTLQYEAVQLDTFGRTLKGSPDSLIGYCIEELTITDPKVIALSGESVHKVLIYTGNEEDTVAGTVFEVTHEEILKADSYEVEDYKRVSLTLKSGNTAWIYVSASE